MVLLLLEVKPSKTGRESSAAVKMGICAFPILVLVLIAWAAVSARRSRKRRYAEAVEERRRRGPEVSMKEMLGHEEGE